MRTRLVGALAALLVPLTAPGAGAATNYPDPLWVAAQPANTCFTGSTVDRSCASAAVIANDYRLAGLAQTNAILAAQPQLAQDEVACPGAMWQLGVLTSRFNATDFTRRYPLPPGVSVRAATNIAMPEGYFALRVIGSTAYSLLSNLYHGQLNGGPTAVGLVSLLYNLTPAGIPRASSTPGSMPLPTSAPSWTSPVPVTRRQPLVLFDLDPAKVHVTLRSAWNDPVAGHGVFIRSLAESAFGVGKAPLVDVTDAQGLYSEASISRALINYSFAPKSIASLSSGTYQCSIADLPVPPLLLAQAVRTLRAKGVHLVSAAGNDATTEYFYPAAFDEVWVPVASTAPCNSPLSYDPFSRLCTMNATSTVTAVGSLLTSGTLATYDKTSQPPVGKSEFSNYGTWVSAWADGDGVVGSYTDGPFRYCISNGKTCDLGDGSAGIPLDVAPTAHLGSKVIWSGTSFAAPMVALWIAAGNPAP